jgi:hypothetical protein
MGDNLRVVVENTTGEKNESDALDVAPFKMEQVWNGLPLLFQRTCDSFDNENQKFMMLLGNLTAMGSILTCTSGEYDGDRLFPNLYLFVNGRASSGKGKLTWSKVLHSQIEGHSTQFIPANNSMEGFMQLLGKTGNGFMFETEGDTLTNILKKDYGNYSDILRKGYHHETVSYYRKTNDVFVEVENPRLSVLLSGTPKQVTALMPDVENGLFSRFLFVHLESESGFKDVFAKKGGVSISDKYELAINKFNASLDNYYEPESAVDFDFTDDQKTRFLEMLGELKSGLITLINIDLDSTANRMGCNFFRIAMIISQVRAIEEGNQSEKLICTDADFALTELIVEVLVEHSVKAFELISKRSGLDDLPTNKMHLYKELPEVEFSLKDATTLGESLSLEKRTIQRFLATDLFLRVKQGIYIKKVNQVA